MDIEEANTFINSLVKNLQVLCHGHVNFNNSIQVIGHLYLNVDSQTNIDYIVNEKVCKDDNSSTMFVSNSYHSEPKTKVKRNQETLPAPDKSDDLSSGHFNITNHKSNSHHQHNLNQTKDIFGHNRKKRIRPEKQYIIHPPKVFKPIVNEGSPLQQSIVRSPKNDFVDNERNLFHSSKQPSTSSTNSPYHTESASQSIIHDSEPDAEESKPFQVIPPIDLDIDLSRVKAEPIDPCDDEGTANFTSVIGTTEAKNNDNDNNCDNSVLADDMCSDDYLIGLRDKTLGLYPTSMQQSSDLASSSSFNLSSSTAAVGTSLFYNSKNSPVTAKKRDDDLPYGCKICDKKFTFQTSLRRHIREKHLNIRFICPHCGMTFTQKVSLFNHVEYRCKGPNPVTFMEKKRNTEMEDNV